MRIRRLYQGKETIFDRPVAAVVIGRPQQGVRIDLDLTPDQSVSRPHSRITLEAGQFWIEDLGSKRGTQVDGQEIKGRGRQPLAAGCRVTIGETALWVTVDAEPEAKPPELQPPVKHAEPFARETETAALVRANEAYSSQTVVVHYPEPIAVTYQRFCQREEPAERLFALLCALEMMMRYLVTLGISDLFQCLARSGDKNAAFPPDPNHAFDFLRHPTKGMLLGEWPKALRYTAALLASAEYDGRRYVEEFPDVCRPGGVLDENLLGALVSKRNCTIHAEACRALSTKDSLDIFSESLSLLDQALEEIRFIRAYPLAFLESISAPASESADQTKHYYVYNCQGTGPDRKRFVLKSPVDMPSGYPFVVAPGRGGLLYLWPLMAMYVGAHSAQPTLHIFEKIPRDDHLFLSEICYATIDGREVTEPKTLHPEMVRDHAWLFQRLSSLAQAEDGKIDLEIWGELDRSRRPKLEGKQLGLNSLQKVVGRGSFGTIYAAIAPDGKRVAVKVLESDLPLKADRDRQFARFKQEFNKLKKAHEKSSHPGIIQCYDLGFDRVEGGTDYYHWYSMELAKTDLARRIDHRNHRPREVQGVPWNDLQLRQEIICDFRAVAAAVAHLHSLDIIHRDIKPSNVLVMEADETLRLSDFGLVKNLNPTVTSRLERPKSVIGGVQGTWQYMAPEQQNAKEEITKSADVYSLGILLAELATGSLPKRVSSKRKPKKKPTGPRGPKDVEPEPERGTTLDGSDPNLLQLPNPLRNFLFRCTDRDPTGRPADAQAVYDRFCKLSE